MNRSQSDWTDNYATDQGSYGYDAAGNLASDSHKGLLFSYNLANLPSKVEGMGYNAGLTYSYGYLSDGTKTSADCGAGFSISKIQSGIDEGMNAKSLYKGVAIHEIGHNLGGDHSDKTTVMQSVNTVIYNSMDPNQNKTLFSYPTFSKAFVKKIFNRRDSRNSTSIGAIWTKKL